MNKQKKIQMKTMFVAQLMTYIAGGHYEYETQVMGKKLCKIYFPKADDLMLESFAKYSLHLHRVYYAGIDIDCLIGSYK